MQNQSKIFSVAPPTKSLTAFTSCRKVTQSFSNPQAVTTSPGSWHHSKPSSLRNITESVSELVSDKHNQWSDSGPIINWTIELRNEVLCSNIGAPFLLMKRCSVMEANCFPILYNSEPTVGQRGSWNRIRIQTTDTTDLKGDGLAREGLHENLHGGADLPDFWNQSNWLVHNRRNDLLTHKKIS